MFLPEHLPPADPNSSPKLAASTLSWPALTPLPVLHHLSPSPSAASVFLLGEVGLRCKSIRVQIKEACNVFISFI